MSDPEDTKAPPPLPQGHATGDSDARVDAPEEDARAASKPRPAAKTLMGMGSVRPTADLPDLPRPRRSTVHSAGPAATSDSPSNPQERRSTTTNKEGWSAVPLTEIRLPQPVRAREAQGEDHIDEFEAEKTQIADDLIVEESDVEVIELEPDLDELDDFEDEKTQIALPTFEDSEASAPQAVAVDAPFKPDSSGSLLGSARKIPTHDTHGAGPRDSIQPSDAWQSSPVPRHAPAQRAHSAQQAFNPEEPAPFEDEKTQVLDTPFESEQPVARLHALEGPMAGHEFFVTRLRNTIGRGEGNSIMVADPAMSRQHLEIVRTPEETYSLRDLQSVNGTALNGTRVREADLYHGDRIEAGQSVLQFRVQGGVPQNTGRRHLVPEALHTHSGQTRAPRGSTQHALHMGSSDSLTRLSTLVTIGAGVLSLILVVAIVFVLLDRRDSSQPSATSSQLYLSAVESIKAREWDEAQSQFLEAKELDDTLAVDAQLTRIEREKQAEHDYTVGLERFREADYEGALEAARAVPQESAYYQDASDLERSIAKRQVDRLYTRAQELASEDDFDGAEQTLEEVLEQAPTHRGALTLRDELHDARESASDDSVEAQEVAAIAAEVESARPQRSRPAAPSSKGRVINFTRGLRLYKTRNFDAAIAFFEDIAQNRSGPGAKRAARDARDIATFQKNSAQAKSAMSAKRWKSARTALRRAMRADASVSRGRGHFRDEIVAMLATTEANLGLSALKQEKYGQAKNHLDEALAQDASGPDVAALRNQLDREARALYIQAVNLRKRDPRRAAENCRAIIAMTPESDPTHRKAKTILEEL